MPGADMNPYFAMSAIFTLGLRGIEKKLSLPGPPVSQLTPEDKKSGKVRVSRSVSRFSMLGAHVCAYRCKCCPHPLRLPQSA